LQSDYIVGFEYLNIPIILDKTPEIITTDYHWGLVPSWSDNIDFRKYTLNARIETINEKPSFRNITQNRCLVIGSSFFEWHCNDAKGKSKTKYEIHSSEDELFSFGGLYTSWTDMKTGHILNSFTIVTTQANDKMKYVHNHAQRMLVMLRKSDEMVWLDDYNNV
jgi:putative SOS response-associated peptidase YedK